MSNIYISGLSIKCKVLPSVIQTCSAGVCITDVQRVGVRVCGCAGKGGHAGMGAREDVWAWV